RDLGFTDLELEAVEQALDEAGDLRQALSPAVLGAGFVRDALGVPDEALAAPGFDLLAHLGLDEAAVGAAERYAFGAQDLADWEGLPEALAPLFAPAALADRLAITAAM